MKFKYKKNLKLERNNFYRILLLLIVSVFVTTLSAPKQTFAGFGISPSDVVNDLLKPGDRYEKRIIISRSDPDEALKGKIETDLPEIESWFTFEPGNEFILPEGESRFPIKVIINVPHDAPYKKYSGALRITGASLDEDKGGVTVVKGAKVQVELATTDIDVTNLVVRALRIQESTDAQRIVMILNVENIGNVPTAPSRILIDVEDLAGNKVGQYETSGLENVEPGVTKEIEAVFRTDLQPGEYFANTKVYLDQNVLREDKLYFRVVNPSPPAETPTQPTMEQELPKTVGIIGMIKNNPTEFIIIISGLIIVPLFLLLLYRKRKEKGNKDEKLLYIVIGLLLFAVFVLVALILSTAKQRDQISGYLAMLNKNATKEVTVDVTKSIKLSSPNETEILGQETANNQNETNTNKESEQESNDNQNTDSEVKGVQTTNMDVENPTLYVQNPQAQGEYLIYKEPDTSSPVVYKAQDGEAFSVTTEITDWYQVQVGNNITGWLQKTSIKTTN